MKETLNYLVAIIVILSSLYMLLVFYIRENEEKIQWCYDNDGNPVVNYYGGYEKCILGSDKE